MCEHGTKRPYAHIFGLFSVDQQMAEFNPLGVLHGSQSASALLCTSGGLCYTTLMIIGISQITLHLPTSHSLKEKRQIIKSIAARVRNHFEVAIAEVGDNDLWQSAVFGVSCVSNSRQHVDEVLGHINRYIEETRPDVEITDVHSEIINF